MRWLIAGIIVAVPVVVMIFSATSTRKDAPPAPGQVKPEAKSPQELIGKVEKLDLENRELVVEVLTLNFKNQPIVTLKIHEDTRIEYWGGKKLKRGPAVIKKGENVHLEFTEDGKLKSIGRLLFESEDD